MRHVLFLMNILIAIVVLAVPAAASVVALKKKIKLAVAGVLSAVVIVAAVVLAAFGHWGAGIGLMLDLCALMVYYMFIRSRM